MPVYRFLDLQLDTDRRELAEAAGEAQRTISLTPRAMDLLSHLVRHHDRAHPKEELLRAVWGDDVNVEEGALKSQISNIRSAMGEGRRDCIRTVPRYGYSFGAEVSVVDESVPRGPRPAHRRDDEPGDVTGTGGAPPAALSAEDLLQELAWRAANEVDANACSIFLWDADAALFVLRESTKLTPYLGRIFLNHTVDPESPGCGITARCLILGQPQLCRDVRADERWSAHANDVDGSREKHCELSPEELHSVLVVPIWEPPSSREQQERVTKMVLGVLRVVRSRERLPFEHEDLRKLERLVNDYQTTLTQSQSFARLMDVGLALHTSELCERACEVLGEILRAKGCSVWLIDDIVADDAGQLTYRCWGATGLEARDTDGRRETRKPQDSVYAVPREASERLTAFVAHYKRNVIIEDASTYDFKKELGLDREPGPGKYSDQVHSTSPRGSGPVMAAPLFFRERFDPSFPATGVIRVARPKGSAPFAPSEQRRFFTLADRLQGAILRSLHRDLMEAIALTPRDRPIAEVAWQIARTVPKLLGGQGCSVFVGNPRLEMIATRGRLEVDLAQGRIQPYDLTDAAARGLTGGAVALNRVIHYNRAEERDQIASAHEVRWSGRTQCEIELTANTLAKGPEKLAIVPISYQGRCFGAIRLPKSTAQVPFKTEDVAMLEAIARHFGAFLAQRPQE